VIHPTADVSPDATIGKGTKVWSLSQIRERASIGRDCIIGRNVYVGSDVSLGDNVKVQNNASLYEGLTVERGVFIGPHVCFTNDRLPRAVNPDGSLKSAEDWDLGRTVIREGASIGASSVVVTGITIGRWALVAAGSVVTRDVPDHGLVMGNPARLRGFVCRCARRLSVATRSDDRVRLRCGACDSGFDLPSELYDAAG